MCSNKQSLVATHNCIDVAVHPFFACTGADLEKLVSDLQSALRSVTHLELTAGKPMRPMSEQQGLTKHKTSPTAMIDSPSPELGYAALMCQALAAALPALQHLTLSGTSTEVGLEAFGAASPCISHVTIQAGIVPDDVVVKMKHLPSLRHLTVSGGAGLRIPALKMYVNGVLRQLSGRKLPLRVLDLTCAWTEHDSYLDAFEHEGPASHNH